MTAAPIVELLAAAERRGCRFRLENDRLVADGLEHLPEPLGRVLYQRRAELRALLAGAAAAESVSPECGAGAPATTTTAEGEILCAGCAGPSPESPCATGCVGDLAECGEHGCRWWRELERARNGSW